MTIRTRLALTYGAAVAITIAVVGLVVWWQFGIALRGALEQRLETRLAAVRSSLENQGQAGLQESGDEPGLFVALIAADGMLIDASAGAPSPLPVGTATGSASEVSSNGRRFLVKADQAQDGLRIVAGGDLAPIDRSQVDQPLVRAAMLRVEDERAVVLDDPDRQP